MQINEDEDEIRESRGLVKKKLNDKRTNSFVGVTKR